MQQRDEMQHDSSEQHNGKLQQQDAQEGEARTRRSAMT
jgi:hypothetical protein